MENNPTPLLPLIQERLKSLRKEIDADLFLWLSNKKYPDSEFSGSLRDKYWNPYLDGHVKKIIDTAFATNREIANEHDLDPSNSINDAAFVAEDAIKGLLDLMADYDQKMRGKGYPQRVARRDVSEDITRSCNLVRTRAENEIKLLTSPKMKTITLPLTADHDLLWYLRNCHKSVFYWLISILLALVVSLFGLGFTFGRNNTFVKLYDLIKNPANNLQTVTPTVPQTNTNNKKPTISPSNMQK